MPELENFVAETVCHTKKVDHTLETLCPWTTVQCGLNSISAVILWAGLNKAPV